MSAIKDELMAIVETIDWVFGDGYAKKNPELVGRTLQFFALTYAAAQISEAIHVNATFEDEFKV
jgi:hypothetical protein